MALFFEYCFYAGVVAAGVSVIWLLFTLASGRARRALSPLCLLLFAGALILGPALLSRRMAVDLGPRDKIVNSERHISLNGWNGESYEFLQTSSDVVVLQMGNQDVDDSTLDLLADMPLLRELDLNDSSITDDGLDKIARLPSLETLRIRGTKITDAGFRKHLMHSPTLKRLDLRNTDVAIETVETWKSDDETRRAFR